MNDMENEYIDFTVAPYALAHVLKALYICKIYNYAVTLEDNDLVIRISVKEIKKIVYKIKDKEYLCCCALKESKENEESCER